MVCVGLYFPYGVLVLVGWRWIFLGFDDFADLPGLGVFWGLIVLLFEYVLACLLWVWLFWVVLFLMLVLIFGFDWFVLAV